jgi:putative membrane-bound dehydrogenase-like protein
MESRMRPARSTSRGFVAAIVAAGGLLGIAAAVADERASAARIMFLVTADPHNYEADRTIPKFAAALQAGRGHACTVIQGEGPLEAVRFPGLDALDTTDLLVVFLRRSAPSSDQLAIIRRHLAAGKPLVGIRTANHAFSLKEAPAAGHEAWWEFVPEVLGCENRGYGKTEDGVDVAVAPGQAGHPILEGVAPLPWHSQGPLYLVKPLIDETATVLLTGSGGPFAAEPIAWTRMAGKSRVFYTSLGYPTDFDLPQYRRLLENVIEWALDRPSSRPPAADSSTRGTRVATFSCDITPPPGQPLFSGDPLQRVALPLLAKGVVIECDGERSVLCALDWCMVCNGTHDSMRRRLAAAVGTTPDRVAVQTVHQHNAPMGDVDGQRLLAQHGDATAYLAAEVLEAVEARMAAAAAESIGRLQAFDRVGTGQGLVERVASNRRIRDGRGRIAGRTSFAAEPLRQLPEGRIDPFVKTITLAAGETPLVRLHYYACHPQVKYGDGVATSDFVGMARERLQDREGVFQIHFNGCGGDVTVGKYNDGTDAGREALADRLLAGIDAAIAATTFAPASPVVWRTHSVVLPRRTDGGFSADACIARMLDPKSTPVLKTYQGGSRLASLRRSDVPVLLSGLQLGDAVIVNLPGEPIVDYQIYAQSLLPGGFVAVAGYGDNGTGYICTAREFAAGGYEAGVANCGAEVEPLLEKGIAALVKPDATAGQAAAAERLPRIPPREPAAAARSFEAAPGFRVEQVAAEPLLHSPVAIDFDDRGRCYVVEMIDYSEQEHDRLGAVRVLEDADGDGRMDTSTLFAKGLSWPTGVLCFDGGVFVTAAPDILYLKDTDGDGAADVHRVVFTGFNRTNVQGLLNSLRWGLDCRVHGATSSAGAPQVTRPDDPAFAAVNLNGRDFSFDPRALDLRPETGALQHGMTFDDWGRKFVSGNSNPLEMVFFEDRYAARNPTFAMPPSRGSIAVDGGADAVYRSSPVEPWRILRTKMRLANPALGMVEGGGRPAGYFTGASGITAYRGDALPAEMRECLIVGDVGSNLVHRERMTPRGPFVAARRIDENSELVRSDDIWFRPAQFANAPDGGLYVIDVYREVIEHPRSLPPAIKQQVDLTSGADRGRLYRIVPESFQGRPRPDLAAASTAELVETLGHRNGWHRDTAARLLYERRDSTAVPPLEQLVRRAALPEGRMHALYALEALGGLTVPTLLAALDDPHARVREHAVRLADRRPTEASLLARLCRMTADDDDRVRYQLAFSLGEFASSTERNQALARLAVRDGGDRYQQAAIFSSLARGAADVLVDLAGRRDYAGTPAGAAVLESLAMQIGQRLDAAEVATLESLVGAAVETGSPTSRTLVAGYLAGRAKAPPAARAGFPPSAAVAAAGDALLAQARQDAVDERLAEGDRLRAVGRLALGRFADSAETFARLLAVGQPREIQLAAVRVLETLGEAEIGGWLLGRWSQLGPQVRGAVAAAVFSRPAWVRGFLEAVETGSVSLAEFDPAKVRLIESYADADIRAGYAKLAARVQASPRQEVLAAYRPALDMPGDAERGRGHFTRACAQCHRVAGVGHEIGPNLAAFKSRGAEAILINLLDPNREVNPLYVNYIAQLDDGRTVTGMIAEESSASITLKRAENATDTIPRSSIELLKGTGQSLMPEGLEKQLDTQAVADLLAYLNSLP